MQNLSCKVWIHLILTTKDQTTLIKPLIEPLLHQCLADSLTEQGCQPECINGTEDHVHLLFLLNPQRTLVEIVKNLKTHSAYLINQENLSNAKFGWDTGCGIFAVGESFANKTKDYIKDQKKTHQDLSFEQEYSRILQWHGLGKEKEAE